MVAEIRALDPKPAKFWERAVQSVTPDILMQSHPDGGWYLELDQETLPRVLVNTEYYALISKGVRRKEEKDYVNELFHERRIGWSNRCISGLPPSSRWRVRSLSTAGRVLSLGC